MGDREDHRFGRGQQERCTHELLTGCIASRDFALKRQLDHITRDPGPEGPEELERATPEQQRVGRAQAQAYRFWMPSACCGSASVISCHGAFIAVQ